MRLHASGSEAYTGRAPGGRKNESGEGPAQPWWQWRARRGPGTFEGSARAGDDRDCAPNRVGAIRRIRVDVRVRRMPIWDDFTHRRRFLEARLVRVDGGSEVREGIQDY